MAVKQSRSLNISFFTLHNPLNVVMAVFNRLLQVVKTVGPVSSAHFFSTEPAGQNLPQSCQTLAGTPLGTSDAEEARTWR